MKFKYLIFAFSLFALASCSSSKKVLYFQDAVSGNSVELAPVKKIKIQPDDKISIIVRSRDFKITALLNMPYYTQRIGSALENSTGGFTQGVTGYLVDERGNINFPVLGELHVAGMTRQEVADFITKKLIEEDYVKDPVVSVDYMNLRVDVMGEVNVPGRYSIDRDEYTLLDAISSAGDMTIYGNRNNVKVLRKVGGKKYTYSVDLTSVDSLSASPVYYLQQNDVVYVEPNKVRSRQSTVNGNNVLSAAFWISVATLISNIALYFVRR